MVDLGTDIGLDADGDLDLAFPLISGRACLAADLVRRLRTRLGSLFWALAVGISLEDQIQRAHSTASLARLRAQVVAECEGDERVLSARCTAEITAARTLKLRIGITDRTTTTEPFELVLEIDKVNVKVLQSP